MRGSNGVGKGALRGARAVGALTLIDKNAYLVTLALVSPTRNRGSRAQTPIFIIENNLFVQMAPPASWPRGMPADSLESGFGPLGTEVKTQGFQTVRLITSQKFP